MIYIQKTGEPEEVSRWKKKFKNKHKREAGYEDIRHEKELQILKNALLAPAHIITTFVYFAIISQPKGACPPGKTVFVPEKPPLFLVKPGIFGYNGLRIQTTKPKGDLYVQV